MKWRLVKEKLEILKAKFIVILIVIEDMKIEDNFFRLIFKFYLRLKNFWKILCIIYLNKFYKF